MATESKPTTGKYTHKKYRCKSCGHESLIGTNHWGECYPRCTNCGWKRPLESGQVHECLEPMPEGYAKPEPWKQVKLGDIAELRTPEVHGKSRINWRNQP